MTEEYIWGCKLTSDNQEFEWREDVYNCPEDGRKISCNLLLKQVVLGIDAADDKFHIVELETMGMDSDVIRQPLVILKSGNYQQLSIDILLSHVGSKLILVQGSGPVYFWGQRIFELEPNNMSLTSSRLSILDESDENEKDETEFEKSDETIKESTVKPKTGNKNNAKNGVSVDEDAKGEPDENKSARPKTSRRIKESQVQESVRRSR